MRGMLSQGGNVGMLYRGVCAELDDENEGKLRPRGTRSEVDMTYGDSGRLQKQGHPGVMYDGSITYGPSEENAVRSQHIESGLNDNCFLSFTRSRDAARKYATRTFDGERTEGYIYEVDESLMAEHGVIARELHDPYFPDEREVSVRAADCGDLPDGIIVRRSKVSPLD